MKKKTYITPEILSCNLRTEGLMDDHTAVLQTSPRVSSTAPGQGGDLGDDDEVAAKPFHHFDPWED
jgi:hypothetical protein